MKKVMMFLACALTAVAVNAATVGWNCAGAGASYAGDAYMVFVIGESGVTSVSQITALLDAGSSVDSYKFGSSVLNASGVGSVTGSASGKTLDPGTYTAFMVLFDSSAPVAGESQYVLFSGQSGLTKEIGSATATVTFMTGNIGSIVSDPSNWKSFGSSSGGDVPEPTSGLLLLVGGAALALRRKQK